MSNQEPNLKNAVTQKYDFLSSQENPLQKLPRHKVRNPIKPIKIKFYL